MRFCATSQKADRLTEPILAGIHVLSCTATSALRLYGRLTNPSLKPATIFPLLSDGVPKSNMPTFLKFLPGSQVIVCSALSYWINGSECGYCLGRPGTIADMWLPHAKPRRKVLTITHTHPTSMRMRNLGGLLPFSFSLAERTRTPSVALSQHFQHLTLKGKW